MIVNPQDYKICHFDGVGQATVYSGDCSCLVRETLKWREDENLSKAIGFPSEVLTLQEIWDQVQSRYSERKTITVFVEQPFSGEVLQAGNYREDSWWQIGQLAGYA